MSKKFYKNYVDDIAKYLKTDGRVNEVRGFGDIAGNLPLQNPIMGSWLDSKQDKEYFLSLGPLGKLGGGNEKYEQKLGAHPSFQHLKTSNKSENHYVVSMFIDIKNSTGLFKKYPPSVVANVCRVIQIAAIHTCWYFDGYIHRLQGDGLMIYFGGKNIPEQKAVDNSLAAASFISYFVKNELPELFKEQGLSPIYTRIGIDFGDAASTLWHNAGVGECSEVTTTSLHTSLACKMQAQAISNGIIVGDNILKYKYNMPKCFTHKRYKTDKGDDEYVYEIPAKNFRYKQYTFDWELYIASEYKTLFVEDNSSTAASQIQSRIESNMAYLEQNATNYRPYFQ